MAGQKKNIVVTAIVDANARGKVRLHLQTSVDDGDLVMHIWFMRIQIEKSFKDLRRRLHC